MRRRRRSIITYKEHSTTFESVALWWTNSASITGADNPEEVHSLVGTYDLLTTLGVRPLLGRTFVEADAERGAAPTVIVAYPYWQRRFGGAENAVGQTLILGGVPNEVIVPPDFKFTQQPAMSRPAARRRLIRWKR